MKRVLSLIQQFEPAGIAARNLRECLLIQLRRRRDGFYDDGIMLAIEIIDKAYEHFIHQASRKSSPVQLTRPMDKVKASIAEILT